MSRLVRVIEAAVPGMLLVGAAMLAAVPWGLGHELRVGMPLFPFLVVHHFSLTTPERMPALLVFASGLALDVMTQGPLGFWSLLFVSGQPLTLMLARSPLQGSNRLVTAGLVLAAVMGFDWLVSSLYLVTMQPLWPPTIAALVATAAYGGVLALQDMLQRGRPTGAMRFERRER